MESCAATTMGVQANNAIRTHLRSLPNKDVSQNALSEYASCKGYKGKRTFLMKLALDPDASFCEVTKVDSATSTEKCGTKSG